MSGVFCLCRDCRVEMGRLNTVSLNPGQLLRSSRFAHKSHCCRRSAEDNLCRSPKSQFTAGDEASHF